MKYPSFAPACSHLLLALVPVFAPVLAQAGTTLPAADIRQAETGPVVQANSHRQQLEPRDRAECLSLEHKIGELEQAERNARYGILRQIQQELSTRRERYNELGC